MFRVEIEFKPELFDVEKDCAATDEIFAAYHMPCVHRGNDSRGYGDSGSPKDIGQYQAKPFNVSSVNYLVQHYDFPRRREVTKTDGWLNTREKMAELHVGRAKLNSMREAGEFELKVSPINSRAYLYRAAVSAV